MSNITNITTNEHTEVEQYILKTLDEQTDGFIVPNQTAFAEIAVDTLFKSIYALIDKGILRVRNCDGLAYEYNR